MKSNINNLEAILTLDASCKKARMMLRQPSVKFWQHITVEPAIFFADIAIQMIEFLNTNLYLQKTCRNNTAHEPDLSTPCDAEQVGLTYITTFYAIASVLSGNVSLIFTMFATTYSDIAGKKRKMFIVLPIVGLLAQTASAILQTVFWSWPPVLGILLNAVLPDLFGGYICVVIFAKVCVCDKSQPVNRLTGLTMLTMVKSAALFIGKGVSGYLLRNLGFLYSFVTAFCLLLLSLTSAILLVNDEPVPVERKITLSSVFGMKDIRESFNIILFSKKSTRHRVALWILMFLGTMGYFFFCGQQSVFYLYLRQRFHWDEEQFSAYSAYKIATGMTGSFLCTLAMDKILKMHDSVIGAFAGFMDTLAAFGFYLAQDNEQLYLVPLVDIFHGGIATSTCYSLMSKFFTDREFGRLHSMYMLFGLLNSFGVPLYNYIFRMTMDDWPNAFFLLSALINGLISFTYCVTYFLSFDIR